MVRLAVFVPSPEGWDNPAQFQQGCRVSRINGGKYFMTEASKHTPGPWSRNIPPASQYPVIFSGANVHVAQVISRCCPVDQVEANTNLIAAAPELLEALENAVKLLWEHCEGLAPRIEPLEAAIAKATQP